jgi:glycosyltransferase involved in cell wall biosynthesis
MDPDEPRSAPAEPSRARTTIREIALLGNHLPRQCGIATFTTDLAAAIAAEHPSIDCGVVAMNDAGRHHLYPDRVRFEIKQGDLASYRRAADFLNVSGIEALGLQHEYGIFGGKAGGHVLTLLRELRMPIVTTLHTILGEPSADQRRVMDEIASLSSRLVVMSQRGRALLREVHRVPDDKIDVVPHGIHTIPATRSTKRHLGLEGRKVILTFGLLSPDKGIEHAIRAMATVARRHEDAIYLVLGATHPHVKEAHGEAYRLSLELLAQELGIEANIAFYNRFVTLRELTDFIAAADVYVTPYLNPEQITSGTLAYALGAGKAVISTPYRYATELLAGDRGVLVPFRDSAAIAVALDGLLSDPAKLAALGARAAVVGREMTWASVARRHVDILARAAHERVSQRRTTFSATTLAKRPLDLPEMNLEHLRVMTDDTGVLQHAVFSIPRYDDGYCLDDNARALLLMALVEDTGTEDQARVRALASRYLAFVHHAFDPATRRFRNFMSYGRAWTEEIGSDDAHGRAIWALGAVVGRSQEPGRRSVGGTLFHAAAPTSAALESPRGWAFAILGIHEYLRAFQGETGVEALQRQLSERLLALFDANQAADWPWFEDRATYDNARLSQALIVAGHRASNEPMLAAGLRSLDWLVQVQRNDEGHFDPIGSDGFYPRTGRRARFDQQPLEACAMVSACLDAWRATGSERWLRDMRSAYRWFLGANALHVSLYDPATGGCRDGLHPDRPNENQGAESTIAFLLALTDMSSLEAEYRLREGGSPLTALGRQGNAGEVEA